VLPRGGDAPALGPTVRRAQGRRICHRRRPARSLAERVVCPPPKVLGLDTPKDAPARPFVIYLVVCVAFPNTLLYPYGSAATGEGRAPVRGCELVCEFVIHRGFIGVGDDGAMKDEEHFLEEQEAHKGKREHLGPLGRSAGRKYGSGWTCS
jgi:hypothetical protein